MIFPLIPKAPCEECLSNPERIGNFDGFISVYCPHNMAGTIVYRDENRDFYALGQTFSPVSAEVFFSMVAAGDATAKALETKKKEGNE